MCVFAVMLLLQRGLTDPDRRSVNTSRSALLIIFLTERTSRIHCASESGGGIERRRVRCTKGDIDVSYLGLCTSHHKLTYKDTYTATLLTSSNRQIRNSRRF